jgi:hypothetical protein
MGLERWSFLREGEGEWIGLFLISNGKETACKLDHKRTGLGGPEGLFEGVLGAHFKKLTGIMSSGRRAGLRQQK